MIVHLSRLQADYAAIQPTVSTGKKQPTNDAKRVENPVILHAKDERKIIATIQQYSSSTVEKNKEGRKERRKERKQKSSQDKQTMKHTVLP